MGFQSSKTLQPLQYYGPAIPIFVLVFHHELVLFLAFLHNPLLSIHADQTILRGHCKYLFTNLCKGLVTTFIQDGTVFKTRAVSTKSGCLVTLEYSV